MGRTSLWWGDDNATTQADFLIGSNGSSPCCSFAVEDLQVSVKANLATVFRNARYMNIRVRRVRVRCVPALQT